MRKNLLKLIRHINMLNPNPKETDPEYKLLENILTDDMITIGLAMKLRTPHSYEEIAKRAKMPLDKATKIADDMALIGMLEYEGDKLKLPIFAPGNMELMILHPTLADEHPEIAYAFREYVENLTKNFVKYFP